ncbi:MAG: hypothetical protein J5I93_21340 [Pirellulaceae bacterium]|nr:hypothetical protein [Pirellulaceae bacterium]
MSTSDFNPKSFAQNRAERLLRGRSEVRHVRLTAEQAAGFSAWLAPQLTLLEQRFAQFAAGEKLLKSIPPK